ncbi:MAG: DedA family protein [Solirubrobacterales bacterium]|nr:DedA family protein [Solirubrobacterales bacterium]
MLAATVALTASITDPVVNLAVDFIDAVGVLGVFILMTLESACIPVPSEATMLAAGFAVSEGDMNLVAVVAAGVLGNLLGSWIAWGAGYYGRTELLNRNRLIHINPRHLAAADRWFANHGDATVFWTRLLPIIRTFISLPAGVARMPFWRFTALTVAGCVPWVLALALLGRSLGENWRDLQDKLHYVDYLVAALIVAGIVYWLIKRRRSGPGGGTSAPVDAAA